MSRRYPHSIKNFTFHHQSFQIRKCADMNCCLPPSLPREKLTWLPDPMLDESGEHFKSYDVVKNKSTSEKDRPSLKLKKPKKLTKRNAAQTKEHSGACSTSDPSTSEGANRDQARVLTSTGI